jgi:hypothetical protein
VAASGGVACTAGGADREKDCSAQAEARDSMSPTYRGSQCLSNSDHRRRTRCMRVPATATANPAMA